VHVRGAVVLRVRQADEQLVAETERADDGVPDERAIVGLGQRLDDDGGRPVRGAAVVNARASPAPTRA